MSARRSSKNEVDVFANKKGFINLPNYNGKAEAYDDWHFKSVTFLEVEDEFKSLLEFTENLTKEPTEEKLKEWEAEGADRDVKVMNDQLYYFLSLNLKEEALTMIKNMKVKNSTCGIASWWKFYNENKALSGQRIQALANAVLTPPRVKKYSEVLIAMDKWERDVNKYEQKTAHKRVEEIKMFSLRQLVPDELDKLITANSNTLKTYEEVKAYVDEQVSLRKDKPKGPVPLSVDQLSEKLLKITEQIEDPAQWEEHECQGEHVPINTFQEAPPEEQGLAGTLENILSFMMKGKSKGKGKGKGKGGKETRECYHCGRYGHLARDCWQKDAEMEEYRKGKGKGKGEAWGKGKGGDAWGAWGRGKG